MTERINSTASTATATFTPTGDFNVQVSIPAASKAYVDVEGQVDAAADWVAIGSFSALSNPPLGRFAKCPFVRVRLYNNDGATVKVWSGE